jgi:hypothetical protein
MEAIEQAQALDRHSVRERAAEEFDSDQIVAAVITGLHSLRLKVTCDCMNLLL